MSKRRRAAVVLLSVVLLALPILSASAHQYTGRARRAPFALQAVTVLPALPGDGYINSQDDNELYAPARDGTGRALIANTTTTLLAGQRYFDPNTLYIVWESFLAVDVSSLAGETATSAALELWLLQDASDEDFIVEVRGHDWSAPLDAADYVPGGDLAGLPLLATLDTATLGAAGGYKTFTGAGLAAAVEDAANGDGILWLVIVSSHTTGGIAPDGVDVTPYDGQFSGLDAVAFASTDGPAGQQPVLTVEMSP